MWPGAIQNALPLCVSLFVCLCVWPRENLKNAPHPSNNLAVPGLNNSPVEESYQCNMRSNNTHTHAHTAGREGETDTPKMGQSTQ